MSRRSVCCISTIILSFSVSHAYPTHPKRLLTHRIYTFGLKVSGHTLLSEMSQVWSSGAAWLGESRSGLVQLSNPVWPQTLTITSQQNEYMELVKLDTGTSIPEELEK